MTIQLPEPTPGDRQFLEEHKIAPALHQRITIEREVFRRTAAALLAAGYELRLHNGEYWATERTTNVLILEAEMMAADEERLYAYKPGESNGWVFFVYGNTGWDVINDHTVNLSTALAPVDEYVDQLSELL